MWGLRNKTSENRGETVSYFSNRESSKVIVLFLNDLNFFFFFFFFFFRKHFTQDLNFGATKSTLIFQEGRLGWILTRPSYRSIGTRRLTRSVLEWSSGSSSSLLSSTIKPDPYIHCSQMENTELLHWAVTRGRSLLGLGPLYNPTVTRKDSM